MNISTGVIATAQKVVFYGPEGIGKTTFASHFPNPVFSDVEGSTNNMNVARFDKPSSWTMLMQQADFVQQNRPCETWVIDTADWAEELCKNHLMAKNHWDAIDASGYGVRYVALATEWGKLLNRLSDIVDSGINVVLTAHAKITKFEQPDEMGAYDRWELKLEKKTAPMTKEWADMVLFANYKTFSVAADDKGTKHKGQGGIRTIHANHHPAWDAKNRHGLPDEFPMDYGQIAHIFNQPAQQGSQIPAVQQQAVETPVNPNEPLQQQLDQTPPVSQSSNQDFSRQTVPLPASIPKGLQDLMTSVGMTFDELVEIAFARGHFPPGTPPESFPAEYYEGAIMANWEQVLGFYEEIKKTKPF